MTPRPWSLQTRLTLWFVGGVGVLFLIAIGFGAWQLSDAVGYEMEALIEEEFAELEIACKEGPVDAASFRETCEALDRSHVSFRLSWRAWLDTRLEPWSTAGSTPSIPFPAPAPSGTARRTTPASGFRWGMRSIDALVVQAPGEVARPARIEVGLLVDGEPRAHHIRATSVVFLLVALAGALVLILGGVFIARRTAGMLEQVAHSAAAARLDSDRDVPMPADLPEEIRQVGEAIRASVELMRGQHARNVLLTAGLAHELRSPLQNMMSAAEVALMRARSPEEYREVLAEQLEEMQALALVVDNLITLTALRDTHHLPRRERFDFGSEAELRLDKERSEAARRGCGIVLKLQGDLTLEGDREALLLMLRNLVGNAVRWTAPGTEVRVELDGRGSELLLTVEDQGPGVREEDRAAIFDAFFQGPAPSGRRAGYGLGLALSKAAVTLHGGEIELAAVAERGAKFVVRLQRAA